jgi:hypothetical protein
MALTKAEIRAGLRKDFAYLINNIEKEEYIRLADVAEIIHDYLGGKKSKTQYWEAICKAYADWYQPKFGLNPDFKGAESANLKQVVGKLKAVAGENKIEWTERNAVG